MNPRMINIEMLLDSIFKIKNRLSSVALMYQVLIRGLRGIRELNGTKCMDRNRF